MIYLLTLLKCSWIKRLFDDSNNGQWKTFYLNELKKYGGKLLFECNLNQDIITRMFPENNFLREIVTAWEKITNTQNKNLKYIGKQIIWNNRHIQIRKKTHLQNMA